MKAPRVGDWVVHRLHEFQAEAINKRRADARRFALEQAQSVAPLKDAGFVVHTGNNVRAGQEFPMLVVRVWESNHDQPGDWLVNGQVFLDGSDVFWVTSARQGGEPGEFHYPDPFRYEGNGP